MTQRRFWVLLCAIQKELASAAQLGSKEPSVRLKAPTVAGYVPSYWREEARSEVEWFIRHCRAVGLYATYVPDEARYSVRWVRDAGDEATIDWPGKFTQSGGTPWGDQRVGDQRANPKSSASSPR